jgi:tetratricopeptide (TPR) repeat protein
VAVFNHQFHKPMKLLISTVIILLIAFVAGTAIYLQRQAAPSQPASVAEPGAPPTSAPSDSSAVRKAQARAMAKNIRALETQRAASPAATAAADTKVEITAFSQSIGTLISPQTKFQEKEAVWKQLQDTGELDRALADLKQRSVDDPNDPVVLTALGELGIFKLRTTQDFNEQAILAMQADQSFNAALKLDPANWEAQYFKAASMYYWPASLNKDQEVVQRLTSLATQQETMSPEPQFARTYVVLGDEYQKLGQLNEAQQTWRLGAQKFPQDPALQKRLSGKNP